MKQEDYSEILARIKHIKSLFAFGEGILPFLEELFLFLREVSPMLNDVSESIMNTTGAMPEAAVEIDKAVDQTSDATFKIMDLVENINRQVDALEKANQGKDIDAETFDSIRSDAHAIINALQFHDIVSQRLIHVRKVLSDIQQKLLALFTKVYRMDIEDDTKTSILTTFGVNAQEFERLMTERIEVGEELTAGKKHSQKPQEPDFGQADIDSLFG
jgi:chemotaxis regulatin CheY-phosphate phosphatase CheZ